MVDSSAPGPRVKSALLWGAVGFLSFLVLVQGYALLVAPLLPITRAVALAFVVGVGTTGGAYALEHRLAAWSARRATGETEDESHGADGKSKS